MKKIPQRQCVACREHKDKPALCRVVRTPEGAVVYDGRGKVPGRGAYLCRSLACLEKAVKSKALSRALECEIPEEAYEALRTAMKEDAHGTN